MGSMRKLHHFLRRNFPNVIDRHIGRGVAHRLRGQPVLAVPAMEVAAEHPERQRVSAGRNMEKGFLLDGIALQCRHIPPRYAQFASLVISYLTDPAPALTNFAAMSAGVTFDCVV